MRLLASIFLIILMASCDSQSRKIDDVILTTKSQNLLKAFDAESKITSADYDTLMDLNYDNIKDFVIGYYGQSGTGLKNKVRVYLFDIKKNDYVLEEQLSDLSNPTFYSNRKKITAFYNGNGDGSGSELEWINGKWTVTKIYEVQKNEIKSVWKIIYPLKNKTEYLARPYQMIPPQEILESSVKE